LICHSGLAQTGPQSGPEHQTPNLEIPGSMLGIAPE